MGEATRLLLGGPAHLYVVAFAVGCALLEVFSRYERYVWILKWTTLSLFAYVATAFVVDVPWGRVAYNIFVPSFTFQKDYIVAIVAVLGTTITP
jgi:Mn2+/Fe2+ NRAMP family transporter